MIFSGGKWNETHVGMILKGKKTQTRRLSDRYEVGKDYAVQSCRTCKGVADYRIVIDRKWEEFDKISEADAEAEGGYTPDEFENLFWQINRKHPLAKGLAFHKVYFESGLPTSRWVYEYHVVYISKYVVHSG